MPEYLWYVYPCIILVGTVVAVYTCGVCLGGAMLLTDIIVSNGKIEML
jgi:hypothetical protein